MLRHFRSDRTCGIDLVSRRMVRIGLDSGGLQPGQLGILGQIRTRCPMGDDLARCAVDCAATAYCPNNAKLRILAVLTMSSEDVERAGKCAA